VQAGCAAADVTSGDAGTHAIARMPTHRTSALRIINVLPKRCLGNGRFRRSTANLCARLSGYFLPHTHFLAGDEDTIPQVER
jgi:hypothetical protein